MTDPVARHLAHLERRNLRPATIYQRRRALTRLSRATGKAPLECSREDLAGWWEQCGQLPEGRACELSHVRQFYKWAIVEELIVDDPTRKLVRPRLQRRLPRPIPDDQLDKALAHAPPRIRPWLFLAAYAGLRAGEIAALNREDVLDRATPPMLIVLDGKGGKQRLIPLSPIVLAALAPMPDAGPMFGPVGGGPGAIPAHRVSQMASRYLHETGSPSTLHALRHRFGTKIYGVSKDLRVTQELLGHSSPVTTALYAQWSPQAAVEAVLAIA